MGLTNKCGHENNPKESEGPFAWRSAVDFAKNSKDDCDVNSPSVATPPSNPSTEESGCDQTAQASLEAIQLEACSLGCIAFKLPKWNSISGKVLGHALQVIETLFEKLDPMIFKFGITHNPAWRWSNSLYGYKYGCEKWSNMLVIYSSWEPYGPAMLEATLIEKFKSISS